MIQLHQLLEGDEWRGLFFLLGFYATMWPSEWPGDPPIDPTEPTG